MGAVEAAVQAARRHGLRVEEPIVVRDLTNVLVRLGPSAFIARVPMTLGPFRGPEWIELEVRAVAWLAGLGAPVAPPATAVEPGPHAQDGFLVTFWDAIVHDPDRADPTAAGRTLRELHGREWSPTSLCSWRRGRSASPSGTQRSPSSRRRGAASAGRSRRCSRASASGA